MNKKNKDNVNKIISIYNFWVKKKEKIMFLTFWILMLFTEMFYIIGIETHLIQELPLWLRWLPSTPWLICILSLIYRAINYIKYLILFNQTEKSISEEEYEKKINNDLELIFEHHSVLLNSEFGSGKTHYSKLIKYKAAYIYGTLTYWMNMWWSYPSFKLSNWFNTKVKVSWRSLNSDINSPLLILIISMVFMFVEFALSFIFKILLWIFNWGVTGRSELIIIDDPDRGELDLSYINQLHDSGKTYLICSSLSLDFQDKLVNYTIELSCGLGVPLNFRIYKNNLNECKEQLKSLKKQLVFEDGLFKELKVSLLKRIRIEDAIKKEVLQAQKELRNWPDLSTDNNNDNSIRFDFDEYDHLLLQHYKHGNMSREKFRYLHQSLKAGRKWGGNSIFQKGWNSPDLVRKEALRSYSIYESLFSVGDLVKKNDNNDVKFEDTLNKLTIISESELTNIKDSIKNLIEIVALCVYLKDKSKYLEHWKELLLKEKKLIIKTLKSFKEKFNSKVGKNTFEIISSVFDNNVASSNSLGNHNVFKDIFVVRDSISRIDIESVTQPKDLLWLNDEEIEVLVNDFDYLEMSEKRHYLMNIEDKFNINIMEIKHSKRGDPLKMKERLRYFLEKIYFDKDKLRDNIFLGDCVETKRRLLDKTRRLLDKALEKQD